MDTAVCVVFLLDFFIQLGTAPDKLRYLRWGWIDLVSSVLRWGRMVRIVRLLRILRGLRATKILASTLFAHRAKGALATVLFICLLLVTFGSGTIVHVETQHFLVTLVLNRTRALDTSRGGRVERVFD